ncbi:MAG: hypothetical protein AAF740_05985 [Bacteroidota bacterium]
MRTTQKIWNALALLALTLFTVACGSDDEPAALPDYTNVVPGTYQVDRSYEILFGNDILSLGDTVTVTIDRVSAEEVRFSQSDGVSFRATIVQPATDGFVFTIVPGSGYEGIPLFGETGDPVKDLEHGIFAAPTDGNSITEQEIAYRIKIGDTEYLCQSFDYQ